MRKNLEAGEKRRKTRNGNGKRNGEFYRKLMEKKGKKFKESRKTRNSKKKEKEN